MAEKTMSERQKIVLPGLLVDTEEQKKQLVDAFQEEFGVEIVIEGVFRTLPGLGGPGDRSDVVASIPIDIVPKIAVHPWHLSGLFSWADDYLTNNHSIIPVESKSEFFKDVEMYQSEEEEI